ncbi:hypothetical protein RDn1_098 [Candidatus Termititenax dinenymphae]|uniref:Uncharacterized protein n=1 Tax=Candidatus Termititenax dinenymphae TaxID=2218523 RepID=A0A388TJI6_9BACT|nr:hypothetical protein RDn1_098 [Candidatus Termititenax dinenymphae]
MASLPKRLGKYLAGIFVSPLYADGWLDKLTGANIVAYIFGTNTVAGSATTNGNGQYNISNLDPSKVYTIVATKGDLNMKGLAINNRSDNKADITPLTTLVVETVSKNSISREKMRTGEISTVIRAVNVVQSIVEVTQDQTALKKIVNTDDVDRDSALNAQLTNVASKADNAIRATWGLAKYVPLKKEININGYSNDWDDLPFIADIQEDIQGNYAGGKIRKVKIAQNNAEDTYYFAIELDGVLDSSLLYALMFTNGVFDFTTGTHDDGGNKRHLYIDVMYKDASWKGFVRSNGSFFDDLNPNDITAQEFSDGSNGIEISVPSTFLDHSGFGTASGVDHRGFMASTKEYELNGGGGLGHTQDVNGTEVIPLEIL